MGTKRNDAAFNRVPVVTYWKDVINDKTQSYLASLFSRFVGIVLKNPGKNGMFKYNQNILIF